LFSIDWSKFTETQRISQATWFIGKYLFELQNVRSDISRLSFLMNSRYGSHQLPQEKRNLIPEALIGLTSLKTRTLIFD